MARLNLDQYNQLQPIQWPVNIENPQGTERMFEDNKFFTPSGKAQFIAITPRAPQNAISKDYPFILNTGRVRDQWHTMTRTARSAKLNGHIPEPFVEIHPDDAETWQLQDKALAKISSQWGELLARVTVTDAQQRGNLFVPMHWNQQNSTLSRVDAVVNPVVDPISGQPESKHTPVTVQAYTPNWHGFVLSRNPLTLSPTTYQVSIKGDQFWRYELASDTALDDVTAWAKQQLGNEGDWLEFSDEMTRRYRSAVIKDNRLESVLFISPSHELPNRAWLGQLFTKEVIDDETRTNVLAGKTGADQPDIGALVCACFGVGENTIKEAIACGKAKSVEDIGRQLKAGTNCG